jgi:hypothetical protein
MWTSDRTRIQTASKLIDFIIDEIDIIDHDEIGEIYVVVDGLKRIRDQLNGIDSRARTCQVSPGREMLT